MARLLSAAMSVAGIVEVTDGNIHLGGNTTKDVHVERTVMFPNLVVKCYNLRRNYTR